MKAGAEINAADPNDISPMLMAIINGHYDVAAFLLDQGADPNIADETGRTRFVRRRGHAYHAGIEPSFAARDSITSSPAWI